MTAPPPQLRAGRIRPAVNTSRQGRYYEHRAAAELTAAGMWVIRASASKGCADLLALGPHANPVLFVQVKRNGSAVRPAEWNTLYRLATTHGGIPILCDFPTRGPARWRRILAPRNPGDTSRLPLAPYEPHHTRGET